ncbi:MAG TPA: hypothetical protein VL096_04825, partial [Pirellulaceae bacterium]|nr:hypothetical protein [Pirellulaceae bacterium]
MMMSKSFVAISVCLFVMLVGCDRGPARAPVRRKVLLDGKPLTFGSVMFQPPGGQPSRADIQADGTFVMDTPGAGPGSVVGPNQIRVTCYSNQDPSAVVDPNREPGAGKSLIPEKYNDFNTSGLT